MDIYKIIDDEFIKILPEGNWYNDREFFYIACSGHEMPSLMGVFNFDQSTIEECLSVDQSIKLESFENYDFVTFNFISHDEGKLATYEINIYASKNYIIFVYDTKCNLLNDFNNSIVKKKYSMLQRKGNMLNKIYYLIFDRTIAGYFETLEGMEDKIEAMGNDIMLNVDREMLDRIYKLRSDISYLKKNISPMAYIGEALLLNDNEIVTKPMVKYFRSLNMRINKLNDFSSDLRHLIDETRNAYDSRISLKTNDKATLITIIAAFFAPPTVIAGIYGMNFNNIPEFGWKYGYPFAIFLMFAASGLMYAFLKHKRWL